MALLQEIHTYLNRFEYSTQVMGASLRNLDQILQLVGCDYLTVGPSLLQALKALQKPFTPTSLQAQPLRQKVDQELFCSFIAQDPLTKSLLVQGLEKFNQDTLLIAEHLNSF